MDESMKAVIAGIFALVLTSGARGQEPAQAALPTKPGQIVRFDVLIVDLAEAVESPTADKIVELEKAGKLTSRARLQLASVEETPASIQFGELAPRVSGRTTVGPRRLGPGGPAPPQVVPQYTSVNVGTTLQVTARVVDGVVVAQVYLERTALAGGAEGPFDPNEIKPAKPLERLHTETTLRL